MLQASCIAMLRLGCFFAGICCSFGCCMPAVVPECMAVRYIQAVFAGIAGFAVGSCCFAAEAEAEEPAAVAADCRN